MAYLNTDNLPSSLPPTQPQSPVSKHKPLLTARQLLSGAMFMAVLLGVVGATLYESQTRTITADPAFDVR